MKKGAQILCVITLCFLFLTTGVFIGRQTINSEVHIDTEAPYIPETLSSSLSDGKININAASTEELMLLPNIGKTLADRIVEYRLENGFFRSIDELTNIEGIGEKRVTELADYITVGG